MQTTDEIKKRIKLSSQSKIFIDNLKDFDLEDFLDWWIENKMAVGLQHVEEYFIKKVGDKLGNQNN